jgi:hypothetical protein
MESAGLTESAHPLRSGVECGEGLRCLYTFGLFFFRERKRMRSDVVPRHSFCDRFTVHVSREEAVARILNGDSRPLMSGNQMVGIKDIEAPRLRECDPCSITSSEMVTNAMAAVGIARSRTAHIDDDQKLDDHVDPDYIELATGKVKMWPAVFDRKAAGVRPRDENLDAKLFAQRKPTPTEKIAAEKRQGAFV